MKLLKSGLSRKQYKALKERLFISRGPRCSFCGMLARFSDQITLDHIVPISRGGGNEDDNLAMACPTCNNVKADQIIIPPSMLVNFGTNRRIHYKKSQPARKAWLI